ncbi:MAG: hypothetical protein RLZZ584_2344 [Pseudomonadota bacterium]|jgi:hypothetical protein
MNMLTRALAALTLAAVGAATPVASHAEPVARIVPDYAVFVDPPTGFVFVKLPAGWKFVGKVEAGELARLPSSVVTALLEDCTGGAAPATASGNHDRISLRQPQPAASAP